MTLNRDGQVETRPLIDREAAVAKNVRLLRASRGVSQRQLGSGLLRYGFGMRQSTVAKLEAGTKPLRLNEVAAIAAFFDVSIESLWQGEGKGLDQVLDGCRETATETAARIAQEAEKAVSDYYTQQRIERIRDKC